MSVTVTIKQVPAGLADGLRRRAAANHRSQQQELLLLLEQAVGDSAPGARVGEPRHAVYQTGAPSAGKRPHAAQPEKKCTPQHRGNGKLDLDALWQRARQLGAGMASESAALVRADRDAGRR